MEIIIISWINEQGGLQAEAFTDAEIAARCMGFVMEHGSNAVMKKVRIVQQEEATAEGNSSVQPEDSVSAEKPEAPREERRVIEI